MTAAWSINGRKQMKKTVRIFVQATTLALAATVGTQALAQKAAQANVSDAKAKLVLAINEGAAGSMTATDIVFRYEQFKQIVEKVIGTPVTLVAVRDARMLRKSVQTGAFALVLSRPADVLAEAVRDYGYQAVVV